MAFLDLHGHRPRPHDSAFDLVMDAAAGGPEVQEIAERLHVAT